jgi:hypothetical protein
MVALHFSQLPQTLKVSVFSGELVLQETNPSINKNRV